MIMIGEEWHLQSDMCVFMSGSGFACVAGCILDTSKFRMTDESVLCEQDTRENRHMQVDSPTQHTLRLRTMECKNQSWVVCSVFCQQLMLEVLPDSWQLLAAAHQPRGALLAAWDGERNSVPNES